MRSTAHKAGLEAKRKLAHVQDSRRHTPFKFELSANTEGSQS